MNLRSLIFISLNIGALGLAVACGDGEGDSSKNPDASGGDAGSNSGGSDSSMGGATGGSGGSTTGGTNSTGGSGGSITPPQFCGSVALGQGETRTRYAAAEVPAGQECESEEQSRTCEADGFSEWSGTFSAKTCVVQTPDGSCGATQNGGEEERTRYEVLSAPFGSSCVSEVQKRTCTDGAWGDFSGTFTAETCSVQAPADCGSVPHGNSDTRVRYEAAEVDFGETCVQETQSALCDNGTLGAWSGTFTFGACAVGPAENCEGLAHGQVLERTRFQSASVPFGQTCAQEKQTQTCNDGTLGAWSGTYTFESCTVAPPADCVGGEHGQTVERTRFQAASVGFGETCQSEVQTQTCNNGVWSDWTGSYGFGVCTVGAAADCDGGVHGQVAERTRYQAATVAYGQSCQEETQTQTCNNGTWSAWTGTFTFEGCMAAPPADCAGGTHGQTVERTRYLAAAAPSGGLCQQEVQSRSCTNGTWSNWTGNYTFEDCSAACDGGVHGQTMERTRFSTATVPYGETCNQETQSQTCNDGTWSAWTGSFNFETCTVNPPADCDGGAHGQTAQRTRYQASVVPFGESCQAELQSQTCDNGSWGDWSGSYAFEGCTVAPPANCDGVAHLGTETRTRYQAASVPNGNTCNDEVQTRACFNGTWGNWSGSYTFTSCTVEAPFAGSCTLSVNSTPYACIDWVGSAYTAPVACTGGQASANHCSTANTLGMCKLNAAGPGFEYHEYFLQSQLVADAAAAQQLCTTMNGTWVP